MFPNANRYCTVSFVRCLVAFLEFELTHILMFFFFSMMEPLTCRGHLVVAPLGHTAKLCGPHTGTGMSHILTYIYKRPTLRKI